MSIKFLNLSYKLSLLLYITHINQGIFFSICGASYRKYAFGMICVKIRIFVNNYNLGQPIRLRVSEIFRNIPKDSEDGDSDEILRSFSKNFEI